MGIFVPVTACAVYGDDIEEPNGRGPEAGTPEGGPSDSGPSDRDAAGTGGAGGNGGAGGASGSGGTSGGSADASAEDTGRVDTDATSPDAAPPFDAARDGGPPDDSGAQDTPSFDADASDISDASTGSDIFDGGVPPSDTPSPPDGARDADATTPDADSGTVDVSDGGPTGRQILPMHGAPIEMPDAGGPFDSRCASDEVVTGFVGRAGVQTDALASTCSKLIGGVLSSPRNLPLNGNLTGGMPFTVACPANYVAVGIVGRFGHNTMWNEDVTTMIGVVCKALASTTTQIVTITGQPALDAGYTSFREDCTAGRYLTDISGRTDANSLGFTVQQVGGECEAR
jgi:hypothetical protein